VRRIVVAISLLLSLPAAGAAQSSFEVLHSFAGAPTDGANSYGGLIQGSDGFFYGTTQRGGASNAGTVYRMTSTGTTTILHSFTGGADGGLPSATLIQGDDGLLYGTALTDSTGFGTVFSVTTSGTVKVLHSFAGFPTDGASPNASLVKGRDGNFYGVTFSGGPSNAGTVYRTTPQGSLTILHAFTNAGDGASPFAALMQVADGSFYGTTRLGTIYKVSPDGVFAVVHQMNGLTEGATLDSALALGADGNLYGTAREGGPTGGGTVFRMTPGGTVTVLHAFTARADGEAPEAGLISGPDGSFYGTTAGGYGVGTGRRVFRITPDGAFTVLHAFDPADSSPYAPLLLGSDGSFYGTTIGGSLTSQGRSIVFRITVVVPVPSAPFGSFDTPANAVTASGEVPVTGWAVDDSGVSGVDIYRSPAWGEPTQSNGLVFLGTATQVAGARPDVVVAYGLYPGVESAGWGYMLLSNMLPSQGNGTFTLYAYIRAVDGATVLLGSKTIVLNNATAAKPFGTIDTPAQGQTVSGTVINFGWALTPQPGTIPKDGSTISVYVDDVLRGHPTYDNFRSDIAALFPGYANSNGAVGHFPLDTTTLADGLHTISWAVVDDAGHAAGLGSRYFTVANAVALPGMSPAIGTAASRPAVADPGCTYKLSVTQASFAAIGGNGNVSVETAPGCNWTVDSSSDFVTITGGATGSGNGVVTYTVAQNQALIPRFPAPARSATLSIAGQPFVVDQAASVVCVYNPNTSASQVSASGGAGQIGIVAGVTNSASCMWSATSHADWLVLTSSTSGHDGGWLTFVVAPYGGAVGRAGTITVAGSTYTVTQLPPTPLPAFGVVETPLDGAQGVSGSIAVTGWAVDDVGIAAVRILRDPVPGEGTTLIPVGSATSVEGARPDIAAAYSGYPNSTRAGWGYLMLTNMLPNLGTGAFKLYAYADDVDGHSTLLGIRVITCTNSTALTPFGAIDTPEQGQSVSGTVTNFGWVLSPGAGRADPPNGGTVTVFIDGAPVGAPSGWTSRNDLSTLFPVAQYSGVGSALGVFTFNSAILRTGVHTLSWAVSDNQGEIAGIGSRYFTVTNGSPVVASVGESLAMRAEAGQLVARSGVQGRRGFHLDAPLQTFTPDAHGVVTIYSGSLDRLELKTHATAGHLRTPSGLSALPVGSRLDADGTFTWQPGAAFIGTYDLVFESASGVREIRVVLEPTR
jgi:uncharacterized repeat protein (TIGR03803 family)